MTRARGICRPALSAALALLAVGLAGCASAAPSADVSTGVEEVARLDALDVAELLPTTAEVNQRLGWTDDVNYESPDFSGLPTDIEAIVEAFGGPIAIGVDCADAWRASGVIPGAPIGAVEMAANMWAEGDFTVRELWLARYPSVEEASAQVTGLPGVIEACPTVSLVPGGRTLAVIPSDLEGAVAYRADDSYSWVVASFGNLVAQVEIGTSAEELASGEALIELQLDKLELIARGEYE